MNSNQTQPQVRQHVEQPGKPGAAQVIQLKPPSRWHDPLKLIQAEVPSHTGRVALWSVSVLVLILIVWAAFGQLDIIASAEGKLATQTLVKIVQPAEAGVVKELLVEEGSEVKAGQVLAKLDPTLARADKNVVVGDLAIQQIQLRRLQAELSDQPMLPQAGDEPKLYAQVQSQFTAHRKAYLDALDQEKALLDKAEQERKSALEILSKLEQTLPAYRKSAEAYARLEKEGFVAGLAAADKQREMTEKVKDLDAQKATVAALNATIQAQQKKVSQLQSTYKSELQKELTEIKTRITQLQPNLDKTMYREGLMELRTPQDGIIKDVATTTVGAVVQPGTVLMTLVPKGERLYADVNIKNDDIGFVQVGQRAQIKLSAYPFQKYGMLAGKVIRISADAADATRSNDATNATNQNQAASSGAYGISNYKARIELETQIFKDAYGNNLVLTPGMQVIAEINQGKRTVLEYLLSPVQKALNEAGRER